jgi:hypothetical protein
MIPKSGCRFSDKIMLETIGMIPKSGCRFSDKIMLETIGMISKSRCRFSDKIMRRRDAHPVVEEGRFRYGPRPLPHRLATRTAA